MDWHASSASWIRKHLYSSFRVTKAMLPQARVVRCLHLGENTTEPDFSLYRENGAGPQRHHSAGKRRQQD